MGLGVFMSSKDLAFPVNAAQEQETCMWSLSCLWANEVQTSSLCHYKATIFTLKPWTSPPMSPSKEHRKWKPITLSPSCPRSGHKCGIISSKLVSSKTRSMKILWTRTPSSLTCTRCPLTLSSADSASEALGGKGPEILHFSQALKWSDVASMNHHRGSKRAGGSSLSILSCLRRWSPLLVVRSL